MNPPQSVNPDYDRGYADGYKDRIIDLLVSLAKAEPAARVEIVEILLTPQDKCPKITQ